MADLIFNLPGIVKSRGEQQDFSGPLTLILQLLSRNKIEIQDVRVSDILEQYLTWLTDMADMDIGVASEFVSMAAHLMYIKTKTLLSSDQPEELVELISTLEKLRAPEIYISIKETAAELKKYYETGIGLLTKTPEYRPVDNTYKYRHEPPELVTAFETILLRTISPDEVRRSVTAGYPKPVTYPIDIKIDEILRELYSMGEIPLRRLFINCSGRSELVAAFVAVLDLCASGRAVLSQDGECLHAGETPVSSRLPDDMEDETVIADGS